MSGAVTALLLTISFCHGSVYSNLVTEFGKYEHRLPGSANFERCLTAVSNELVRAGFTPRVQTFDTLVPRTFECQLTVDGREVKAVHCLNNGVGALAIDPEIEGPLVWLGDGSLDALEGKPVDGCIAVLDMDAPRVTFRHVLPNGARAILLVGSAAASQWSVTGICDEGPAAVPRFYVGKALAEEVGLTGGGARTACIKARAGLTHAVARNLWVEIPGRPGAQFRLDQEEAIILSATLGTAGVVPELCPQQRAAANAALLADTACALAASQPARSVFVAFFGAHFWAQEGARHFYYAISRANERPDSRNSLTYRADTYRKELAAVADVLAECETGQMMNPDYLAGSALPQRVKQKLTVWVNNANADLRIMRQRLADDGKAGLTGDASLRGQIDQVAGKKALWNELRRRLNQGHWGDMETGVESALADVLGQVRRDLVLRAAELERIIGHNESHQVLAERFQNKALVGHFDFDFANDRDPWLFSPSGAFGFFESHGIAIGPYLTHLAALGTAYESIRNPAWAAGLLPDAIHPSYKPFSLCVPVQRNVPSAAAAALGCAGYQLMTAGQALDGDALPLWTTCALAGLREQMAAFARVAAESEALSLRHPLRPGKDEDRLLYLYRKGDEYEGIQCVNYSRMSQDVEGPAHRAVVVFAGGAHGGKVAGTSRCAGAGVNREGYVFMPLLGRAVWGNGPAAFGFDEAGRLDRCSAQTPGGRGILRRPLFYAFGGGYPAYGYAPVPTQSDLYKPRVMNARTGGSFRNSYGGGPSSLRTFYADRPGRFKMIGGTGEILLGSTPRKPMGAGIPLDAEYLLTFNAARQCAGDYWLLNESRLAALRKQNIVDDALEELHSRARRHIAEAETARQDDHFAAARAHDIFAGGLENRVYGPLRNITDDLVKAVIVLLLLNIPFAFAMERLVFGFTSIYKQVAGFCGFFLATFGILYISHPAFSLASAPLIIFLAFVIILLSALALVIVLGKIRQEIKSMQGLASRVHGSEGERGTAMAAVLIGISGMRNRPLKTTLTAVTVILLTFTILVFASFTSRLGVVEKYVGKGQAEDRIELHRFSYLDIHPDLVDAIEALCGGRYRVFRRGGIFRIPTRAADLEGYAIAPDRVLYHPGTHKTTAFGAVMGIEPGEIRANADMQRLLPSLADWTQDTPPIYLTTDMAARLDARKGDELKLFGRTFIYAGTFDTALLQNVATVDNTKIVPPDFAGTVANMGGTMERGTGVQDLEENDVGSFEFYPPEQVAIAPLKALLDNYPFHCHTYFVGLYPRSGEEDPRQTARKLAPVFHGAIHVKSGDGAHRVFFTRKVEGSGFGDVIVPLLLGGLIIFSSLMGSIVDREREIFTYSALGLSPPTVGALFLAESGVYSVIGGMGGYLLSQVVGRAMAFCGSLGWIHPPALNFSSLSSVLTIVIVMAVVILSAIYPAIKAGKSANPGVARKWRMPAPRGDDLQFVFPFTVSGLDFTGIISFMKEHFENHADATLGSFAAKNIHLFRGDDTAGGNARRGIAAEISLAPFDLGIFQHFRMYSKEMEIEGIDEVVVEMRRVGGTRGAWVRGNRMFADDLRRQFLLWRSLPAETVEHYREMTQQEIVG